MSKNPLKKLCSHTKIIILCFTLTQSQPLFSPKRKSVYPIFDIFLAKLKCQIPPVAYHYFEIFGGIGFYKIDLYKYRNNQLITTYNET